jgi:hypothetical protein
LNIYIQDGSNVDTGEAYIVSWLKSIYVIENYPQVKGIAKHVLFLPDEVNSHREQDCAGDHHDP